VLLQNSLERQSLPLRGASVRGPAVHSKLRLGPQQLYVREEGVHSSDLCLWNCVGPRLLQVRLRWVMHFSRTVVIQLLPVHLPLSAVRMQHIPSCQPAAEHHRQCRQ
jgi:hypothetical protein